MGLLMLAVIVIVLGLAVRAFGPSMGKSAGAAKLAGYGLMFMGLLLAIANTFTLVGVGEVGVKHFLGDVDDDALTQGVHMINPMASVVKMSTREQSFPPDGGVERIEAQTSEQLNVNLEISILYRIDPLNAPSLYERIGDENQIKSRIVLNAVRNGVRDAVATKSINEIFSPNRREVAGDMMSAIQDKAGDRIEVLEVFVRDVQAPDRVRQAIEEKLQREQNVAAERFQTEIVQERAQQKIEEAKGIAEAQKIISEGLTDEYLTFYYIEQLGQLPAGSVVYVPTEGGIPLMRNLGGG
ncbi:MAG: prohibitin family protein [Gemmatimonadota bacterium]|jgi:regulator of protease activity HflC (stomatin/prohibitin superfamily)